MRTATLTCYLVALLALGTALPFNTSMSALFLRDDIFKHLRALEEIAYRPENHGSRSVLNGYADSGDYVEKVLNELGDYYTVSRHHFEVPIYEELATPSLEFPNASPSIKLEGCPQRTGWLHYQSTCDYAGIRYGGDGEHDVTAQVTYVGIGCGASDWENFPKGNIALVVTGTCDYLDKALNAEAAGAAAVLMTVPEGTTGLPGSRVFRSEWAKGDPIARVPVLAVTSVLSGVIRQHEGMQARVRTNTRVTVAKTFNIIAEHSASATTDTVVMSGSHLDGVPEGPGINDNGSGSSMQLAIAQSLARKHAKPHHVVRFGWWGAEEVGLIGSRAYVNDLLAANEAHRIALYLNYDMMASPNGQLMVHDGKTAPEDVREASLKIQSIYEKHFKHQGLASGLTGMEGGSDYLPFLLGGIPSGGLATGASGIKTVNERSEFGGVANAPHDPGYHSPYDSVDNVDETFIMQNCGAALHVLTTVMNARDLPRRVAPLDQQAALRNLHKVRPDAAYDCNALDEQP